MTDNILPLGDLKTTMSLSPLNLGAAAADGAVDKAAQDFEAMFATQLIQPMMETVPVDSSFGGGHGEEVMRSFLVQEYGKFIAKTGRLGIAPQVKAEMLRAQESARGKKLPALSEAAYKNANEIGAAHVSN